jgi:hypothetical protein
MSLEFIKQYAPNISKEAEDYLYKNSPEYLDDYARTTTNHKHIRKLIDHPDLFVSTSAAMNRNAGYDNIEYAINHNNHIIRTAAMRNPSATHHHIDAGLEKNNRTDTRINAASHQNATEGNLLKALDDDDDGVKIHAIANENANERVIDKALDSGSVHVKMMAVRHKNATKANLEKALRDPDDEISTLVKYNPRYREYFPNGH